MVWVIVLAMVLRPVQTGERAGMEESLVEKIHQIMDEIGLNEEVRWISIKIIEHSLIFHVGVKNGADHKRFDYLYWTIPMIWGNYKLVVPIEVILHVDKEVSWTVLFDKDQGYIIWQNELREQIRGLLPPEAGLEAALIIRGIEEPGPEVLDEDWRTVEVSP